MLVRQIEDLRDMLVRYNYTANLSRGNWAWEFARRNSALRDDAYAVLPNSKLPAQLVGRTEPAMEQETDWRFQQVNLPIT